MIWFSLLAVNITVDPETAHPLILLSSDQKQVSCGKTKQQYPESPKRFVSSVAVLGDKGFRSGRFYYEVQVSGKIAWTLGVARESIARNSSLLLTPSHGFWGIWLRYHIGNKIYRATNKYLKLEHEPERVGVFVDYKAGSVSFYDADTWNELYSYRDANFREEMYPYFSPSSDYEGENVSLLIIHTPNCVRNSRRCQFFFSLIYVANHGHFPKLSE